MPESHSELPSRTPAATVVLLRDDRGTLETLLMRRSAKSPVFPDAWVFPGGKVAADDRLVHDAAAAAAVRETWEEAGVHLEPAELVLWSRWCPPTSARAQFDTSVYLAAYAGEAASDGFETVAADWVEPAAALAAHAREEMEFLPPTWMTLHQVSGFDSVEEALSTGRSRRAPHYESCVVAREPTALGWFGDEHHDADPGAPGERHRLVMGARPWRLELVGRSG